jgi:hypothetical protein
MKPSLAQTAFLLLAIAMSTGVAFADQRVLSDDGREVLLKEDGTWEFLSTDRFVNTQDGRRARLKADGTWVYLGNAPLTTEQRARTATVDIKLRKIEIESRKEKVHKNVRKESQMVFYLNVDLSPLAEEALFVADTVLTKIEVRDDKSNRYPVLSLMPSGIEIAPNTSQAFIVRADGAPSAWSGVKSMEIELAPGTFANPDPIAFSQKLYDIEEKLVADLDESE